MKRILALLIALLMLTGCSADSTEERTVTTLSPTEAVMDAATVPETESPAEVPTEEPTEAPTEAETEAPTEMSTEEPTASPAEPPATEPPAADHKHNYSSRVTAPSCAEKGYTTYTCSCGHSYKDAETNATGHDYKSTVIAPTKTAQGYTLYQCENCDNSYKDNYTDKLPSDDETEPPHQHSYSSQVTAPTCTAQGYTTYTCSCGDSYMDDETAATGHAYKTETVAPTTEAQGYDLHTCKTCDDSYKDNYTDKLPAQTEPDGCPHEPNGYHSWRSWVAVYDEETGELLYWERTCAWTDCNGRETREAVTPPEDTEPEDGCDKHDYEWVCDPSWEFDTGTCTICGATKTIYASSSTTSQEVIDAINAYRKAAGLSELQFDHRYDTRICMRAAEITVNFRHRRLDGGHHGGGAECIAGGSNAQSVVDGWYNSSSHNGLIMDASATRAAAAYNGTCWVVWIM